MFLHSSPEGHLTCFQGLIIMSKAAINICVQVFVLIFYLPLVHPVSSKRYPSRLESRAGFVVSTRDECLSPRVRLECNPEIPVAPGVEARFLDTSLDEVYWPCSHSRAIPSFPSQLEWKIGLPWANTRGILNSPS